MAMSNPASRFVLFFQNRHKENALQRHEADTNTHSATRHEPLKKREFVVTLSLALRFSARSYYREALQPLGALSPGAARGRREARLGERPADNRGYKTGTDSIGRRQVDENKCEILAERVGFEPTVGVSLHTLSKRAP